MFVGFTVSCTYGESVQCLVSQNNRAETSNDILFGKSIYPYFSVPKSHSFLYGF